MGVIFKYLVPLLLSTTSNDVDNLERAKYYDDELVQKDEGVPFIPNCLYQEKLKKGADAQKI